MSLPSRPFKYTRHAGKFLVEDTEDGKLKVSGRCVFTNTEYSVKVEAEELEKFMQGMFAQDAFPNLSADDREFLISGVSPEGFNAAFKD